MLCNRADATPSQLAREVARQFLPPRPGTQPPEAAATEAAPPASLSENELREYVGDYW